MNFIAAVDKEGEGFKEWWLLISIGYNFWSKYLVGELDNEVRIHFEGAHFMENNSISYSDLQFASHCVQPNRGGTIMIACATAHYKVLFIY